MVDIVSTPPGFDSAIGQAVSGTVTVVQDSYPIFSAQLTDQGGPLDASFSMQGVHNANGNYLVTPGDSDASGVARFWIAPAPGEIYHVHRLLVRVEDVGTLDSGFYGNNIVLTSGVVVRTQQNGNQVTAQLTCNSPILTNAGWADFCYDVVKTDFGQGNVFLHVRWTFAKSGRPIRLVGDEGDFLEIVLGDDFSGLVSHGFTVQGYVEGR